MIRAGFGNVLQGNVPGRKWVRVGIGRADNRVDKESLYGQRDKPGDVSGVEIAGVEKQVE